jgi:hypothetical protein
MFRASEAGWQIHRSIGSPAIGEMGITMNEQSTAKNQELKTKN